MHRSQVGRVMLCGPRFIKRRRMRLMVLLQLTPVGTVSGMAASLLAGGSAVGEDVMAAMSLGAAG